MGTDSHKTQQVLGFTVPVFTACLVLACGFYGAKLLQDSDSASGQSGGTGRHAWELFLGAVVWLAALALLRRIGPRLGKSRALLLTVNALALFMSLLGVHALLAAASSWASSPTTGAQWPTTGTVAADLLCALLVATSATLLLPGVAGPMGMEQNQFEQATERSLDDFYLFDSVTDSGGKLVDFRFRYLNANVERRLRLSRDELIGRLLTQVRPGVAASGLLEEYRQVVLTGVPFDREIFFDDELIRATWIHVKAVRVDCGIAVTSRDVTDSRRRTDHVSYLAHYDQLTALPNRTLLEDRLEQAIVRADRQNHKVAVFVVDIDQFKEINDSFGHAGGDELLISVSKRLRLCVRESDTVARLGGDEFVVVMPDFKSLDEVRACGLQLVEQTARPIAIDGREVSITISVGVCLYPDSGGDARRLVKNADAAMYLVKSTGRNGMSIFSEPAANDTTEDSPANDSPVASADS